MVRTKGNVIVDRIEIGDIHYEYEYGMCVKVEVITKPARSEEGRWTWKSKVVGGDKIIDYTVTEGFSPYSPNLYDYEAYKSR